MFHPIVVLPLMLLTIILRSMGSNNIVASTPIILFFIYSIATYPLYLFFVLFAVSVSSLILVRNGDNRLLNIMIASLLIASMLGLPFSEIVIQISSYNISFWKFHHYNLYIMPCFLLVALIWLTNSSESENIPKKGAALLHTLGAIGTIMAGDMIALLISFEIATVGAIYLVLTSNNSLEHSMNYIKAHILGGILMLVGTIGQIAHTNSYDLLHITSSFNEYTIYQILLLLGLLINCAAFPFCNWMTNTYSTVSSNVNIIFTAFTTKITLFTLNVLFQGNEMLIYIGLCTSFYGIMNTFLENNIKKIICYALLSTIGTMITLIGINAPFTDMAIAILIIAGIIYQAILFKIANIAEKHAGIIKLQDASQYNMIKSMPLLIIPIFIATLSLTSVPFSMSFLAKSILNSAEHQSIFLIIKIMNIALFASMKLRFTTMLFFNTDKSAQIKKFNIPIINLYILTIIAIILPILVHSNMSYVFEYSISDHLNLITFILTILLPFLVFIMIKIILKRSNCSLDNLRAFDLYCLTKPVNLSLEKLLLWFYKIPAQPIKNYVEFLTSYLNKINILSTRCLAGSTLVIVFLVMFIVISLMVVKYYV